MLARTGKNNENVLFYDLQVLFSSVHIDRLVGDSVRTINRKILFVCLLDHKLPDTLDTVKQVHTQFITQHSFLIQDLNLE